MLEFILCTDILCTNIYLYDVIEINSNNLLKKEYCQGYTYSSIN